MLDKICGLVAVNSLMAMVGGREFEGADPSIRRICATPEREASW